MEYQVKHSSPYRAFRTAVLAGRQPASTTVAQLEALGVNTDELQARLIQSKEYKH